MVKTKKKRVPGCYTLNVGKLGRVSDLKGEVHHPKKLAVFSWHYYTPAKIGWSSVFIGGSLLRGAFQGRAHSPL